VAGPGWAGLDLVFPREREDKHVGTLRLLESEGVREGHAGEIYSCCFAPDGAFILSAGWDGHLRLWEATSAAPVCALRASPKPLACCAFSRDGRQWLSGSMEGILSLWDAVSHAPLQTFVAHTRPISAITFAPDGQQLATSSWDRHVTLRQASKEREGKSLSSHNDIVAGCRFSADGSLLLSWSHDGSVCVWDAMTGSLGQTLLGHDDRVTAAALSPDGRWVASGGRDGVLKLWALDQGAELASVAQSAEIRGCFFLLDGQSLVTVDANGWLVILAVPSLEVQGELSTGLKVLCGDLAPAGNQIALGCEDGLVRLVALEDFDDAPLIVTASQGTKATSSFLGRLLGTTRIVTVYSFTCPTCQTTVESTALSHQPFPCPKCKRRLRFNSRVALQHQ
jgi:WD40 repeat protein